MPINRLLLLLLFVVAHNASGKLPWGDTYAKKTAVVTGGSSGIGQSIARGLASSGANVILVARDPDKLAAEVVALNLLRVSDDQRFAGLSVDVSQPEEVQTLFDRVIAEFESVDYVFNVAGFCYPERLENIPSKEIADMVNTNLLGTIYVTRAFLPHFLRQKRGHVVSVASMATYFNFYGLSVYSATKAGLLAFSKALRNELVSTGVKVSLLLPPDTDTPGLQNENLVKPKITAQLSGGAAVMAPERVADALLRGVAQGKFEIVPGRINQTLVFLARHFSGCIQAILDVQTKMFLKN